MRRRQAILWASFFLIGLPSCSVNILTEFADPTTDRALFFAAKQLVNKGDYTAALTKISAMSTTYLATREVKILEASAYAGRCGLNFINFVNALSGMGATRLMPFLVSTFAGGNASKQADCVAAETDIKAIDPQAVNRTSDENLLMAFIGLAKVGTILTRYADTTPADGTADAGFDPCGGTIPSADAKQVATGITIAIDSLNNIGGSSIGSGALSGIVTVCGALPAPYQTLCGSPALVDTTSIGVNEEKAIRTMLDEDNSIGLGTNCTGDVSVCFCP